MEDLKFNLTDPELEKIEDPIIKQKAYLSKEVMDKRLERYKLPEFDYTISEKDPFRLP
jgi:hypothetical protein